MKETPTSKTVMQRCDILANFSEEQGCLTRRFATEAMRQVNATVASWMQESTMTIRQDNIGNLIGRYEASHPGAKTFLLGSHLDTVRDAGKYDGPLGVLIALACVERLHQRHERLPFAIEILCFADEEGLRYRSTYLGSKVMAGIFDHNELQLTDADGIVMAEAIRAFGGNPDALQDAKRQSDDLLGYCEVHIEQGPVLEALNLPVGVVSSITGRSCVNITWTGEAGHAGTVPMQLRRDALCAAAEFALEVEKVARNQQGLVATIGKCAVQPGASNVIPGQVILSLDIRHQDDQIREQAYHQLQAQAQYISKARQVSLDWNAFQADQTVSCTSRLAQPLAQGIVAQGYPVHILPSGAGHDATVMAHLTDIAMLFVRCKGGISHNPAESVTPEDVAVAIDVLEQFLLNLAHQ